MSERQQQQQQQALQFQFHKKQLEQQNQLIKNNVINLNKF